MCTGIGYVFEDPVRYTGIEGVIGEGESEAVKYFSADARIIVQNLWIDVHSSNWTDQRESLGSWVTGP
jgi:hypothetical protein